jgi:hypothetical protein
MWLTITLILVAMIALVAVEGWFFWRLGERYDGARGDAPPRRRIWEAGTRLRRRDGHHRGRSARRGTDANLSRPVLK